MTSDSVTLLRRPPAEDRGLSAPPPVASSRHRGRPGLSGYLYFDGFLAIYLFVGGWEARHNIVFADALSRVGNAYYVLYSRDPHLPAIGFVWNPLPSLVLLPILPFKAVFPILVSMGAAGIVQSALFMAGAIAAMNSCLRRLGVPTIARACLTVLFGLQPMILLYGGSGTSEAMLLFFLLITCASLISWVQDRRAGDLVLAGVALALSYMTRYEAVGPAIAVALVVGILTFRRARSASWRDRMLLALNDMAIVGSPFAFAFALWAISSKIIVNQWFATFSSAYGNSAQVASGRSSIQTVTGSSTADILSYVGRQISGLSPFVMPLLLLAVFIAIFRRQVVAVIAPAVLGAVLLFDNLTTVVGGSFGWLRFQIAVIPLSFLLAGGIIAGVSGGTRRADPLTGESSAFARQGFSGVRRDWVSRVVVAALVVVMGVGLPAEARTLTTTRGGLAREESPMLRSTFYPRQASKEERKSLRIFQTERQISRYIDGLDLPRGSVLTDTAYAYSVVLASQRPTQFVITSDRDFDDAVSDPTGHHIAYMLVPSPSLGPADALGRYWHDLYLDGGRIGILVKGWRGTFFGNWRLYRVR